MEVQGKVDHQDLPSMPTMENIVLRQILNRVDDTT